MSHSSGVEYGVLLIGGTSHVGKTTIAEVLASRLGFRCQSTDSLARHPGRPWRAGGAEAPHHVGDHYLSLSDEELLSDVLGHYRYTVWPRIEESVRSSTEPHALSAGLVIEGSAILPDLVVQLKLDHVGAVWLTAEHELLRQRIHAASQYTTRPLRSRTMIDKFVERTRRFNDRTMDLVSRLGLAAVTVDGASSPQEVAEQCLARITRHLADQVGRTT